MQQVLDSNTVAILYLANWQILWVICTVNESRHHVRVRPTFNIFGIPQNLPNNYSYNGCVDEESLVDLLQDTEPVQQLLHRHMYLE